jgi:hypothetical protein
MIPEPRNNQKWVFEIPSVENCLVQLLTTTGDIVTGRWEGALGQYFSAWAPMTSIAANEANESEMITMEEFVEALVQSITMLKSPSKNNDVLCGYKTAKDEILSMLRDIQNNGMLIGEENV